MQPPGEDAFTSDMYNRRLLAFYVPTCKGLVEEIYL